MSQYYKKYMKKRDEEKPSYFKLFIGAFLVIIAFFAILVTHLSLSMDTNIGENDEGDMKESGLGVKHLIDSRLRFIQMEDISGNSTTTKPQDNNNLERYGKTVQEEAAKGYSGQYQNSYGYDTTQQARPYSQTYTTTQKSVTTQPVRTKTTTNYQAPVSVPTATPATHKSTSAPATHTSTPAHNIQKNLAPAGM